MSEGNWLPVGRLEDLADGHYWMAGLMPEEDEGGCTGALEAWVALCYYESNDLEGERFDFNIEPVAPYEFGIYPDGGVPALYKVFTIEPRDAPVKARLRGIEKVPEEVAIV